MAKLLATLRASGRSMPVKDRLIAATALVHDLVVATRNGAGFENAGVGIVDPSRWERENKTAAFRPPFELGFVGWWSR